MAASADMIPKELRHFELVHDPRAAAWCQDGQIVVRDLWLNKLHTHEAGGREIRTATLDFKPCDIRSFQDKVYITECDTNNGRLFIYNSNLKLTNTFTVGYKGYGGVAVTDRFMFVTSSNEDRVYRVEMPSGGNQQAIIVRGVKSPGRVATNGRKVVVGSNKTHTVWVYDIEGNLQFQYGTEESGPGQLYCPYGVAIDHADTVFICEADNKRVCIVSSQGHHMRNITLGNAEPRSVVVTSQGQIMIACSAGRGKPGLVTFYQY